MANLDRKMEQLQEPEENRFQPVFTAHQTVNRLLNEYRTRLRGQRISFHADGEGMERSILSDDTFVVMLTSAMELACAAAEGMEEQRCRYVRIRTMCAQKKLFLKIEYTSEHDQQEDEANYETLQEIISEVNGYLKLENGYEKNVLKIALPIKAKK